MKKSFLIDCNNGTEIDKYCAEITMCGAEITTKSEYIEDEDSDIIMFVEIGDFNSFIEKYKYTDSYEHTLVL